MPCTGRRPLGACAGKVDARAQVGSILNFSLMYLLAPTAGAAAGGGGLLQRVFSEQMLVGWGAPGASHACTASYQMTSVSSDRQLHGTEEA
jgi:hypothetical protein